MQIDAVDHVTAKSEIQEQDEEDAHKVDQILTRVQQHPRQLRQLGLPSEDLKELERQQQGVRKQQGAVRDTPRIDVQDLVQHSIPTLVVQLQDVCSSHVETGRLWKFGCLLSSVRHLVGQQVVVNGQPEAEHYRGPISDVPDVAHHRLVHRPARAISRNLEELTDQQEEDKHNPQQHEDVLAGRRVGHCRDRLHPNFFAQAAAALEIKPHLEHAQHWRIGLGVEEGSLQPQGLRGGVQPMVLLEIVLHLLRGHGHAVGEVEVHVEGSRGPRLGHEAFRVGLLPGAEGLEHELRAVADPGIAVGDSLVNGAQVFLQAPLAHPDAAHQLAPAQHDATPVVGSGIGVVRKVEQVPVSQRGV
mmetsp:Transcript_32870/g.92800  ORF Transcript_32870/g.92800 Transcript_32870/m.92800 type:complete len:358 (-) Transcript_32870:105-1178(-)